MHLALIVREIKALASRLNWTDPEKEAFREEFHRADNAYGQPNKMLNVLCIHCAWLKSFIEFT
jgi:hypothetical protein